jgi:hypothetical protein
MEPLTEPERAYLAGIFDGEGCVGFYRSQKKELNYRACIKISNTDFWLMKWLDSRLPFGSLYTKEEINNHPNWRQIWEWSVKSRKDVIAFLELVRPYLIIKSAQAELLLPYLTTEVPIPRRCKRDEVKAKRNLLMEERQKIAEQMKALKASPSLYVQ